VAYYKPNDKIINPKLMLRFDCKQINHIKITRLPITGGDSIPDSATIPSIDIMGL